MCLTNILYLQFAEENFAILHSSKHFVCMLIFRVCVLILKIL